MDKTGLIAHTNSVLRTKQKYLCVSRPLRFGKSTAEDMLAAYYECGDDSRAMFEPFEIAAHSSFNQYLNRYNVVMLNIQNFLSWAKNDIANMEELIAKILITELRKEYGDIVDDGFGILRMTIDVVAKQTNIPFIFLIDEWDCIFRIHQHDSQAQKQYLDFIRGLFKDNEAVHLVYMTGILPVKKYGQHSALNMFDEYSMMDQRELARFTGFTQEEVDALCDRFNMDRQEVRSWYNGYRILGVRREEYEIYNPKSVVDAMLSGHCWNYWTKTETYEALKVYMEYNIDGLRDKIIALLAGKRQSVNTQGFTNDMVTFETADDVLTLLIHLGYLGYDFHTEEVFIPNKEIVREYAVSITNGKKYPEIAKALNASKALLEAAWAADAEAVAAGVEAAHFETAQLTYNSETALSYVISLAFYAAREYYTVVRELPAGKGFADIAFIPQPNHADKPAMLVELKWDASAAGAIAQIAEKRYPQALEAYSGNLILIGVNYSRETKQHTCEIRRNVPK